MTTSCDDAVFRRGGMAIATPLPCAGMIFYEQQAHWTRSSHSPTK